MPGPLRFAQDPESYAAKFMRLQEYVKAGDIYQVNFTFPAHFAFAGDALALYRALRGNGAGPHGAYVFDGTRDILSFSPELFFSLTDGVALSRPMKGTAPRGGDEAADARTIAALAASEKDRAENLMIVDLIRNDLGRVAETGQVRVDELFAIETYPTVHQMVSSVSASLRPGVAPSDLIAAMFPCGSVTGAPKILAMEIIRELESEARGVYCGAIGRFSPDGSADFNVAIRTLTIEGNAGTLGVGSGVVADSSATGEYDECLVKARYCEADRPPLSLIETLRHEPAAGFLRGASHLARMAKSAKDYGIAFDADAAERAMAKAVTGRDGPSRVRLELQENGSFDIRIEAYAPQSDWTYVLSDKNVASTDMLARHKTGWRALFDAEFARLRPITGCDQVLFLNERGEVVEGNTANIFLRRDGGLLTPPLSSWALDGVLRRDLLDNRECEEAVLTPADLANGEIYFGNSLRGLISSHPVALQAEKNCAPVRSSM